MLARLVAWNTYLLEVEKMARKKTRASAPVVQEARRAPDFPPALTDLDASGLSARARCFWAKTGDGARAWLSVVQHLMDAADVAGYLFD